MGIEGILNDHDLRRDEFVGPMTTTLFKGIAPQRLARLDEACNEKQKRSKVDSCLAFSTEREVVAKPWPEYHRAADRYHRAKDTPYSHTMRTIRIKVIPMIDSSHHDGKHD